jgi:hypothetical protein
MDIIKFVLGVLFGLFILIAITRIIMEVANHVGEQLGFGKFFLYLWRKIREK